MRNAPTIAAVLSLAMLSSCGNAPDNAADAAPAHGTSAMADPARQTKAVAAAVPVPSSSSSASSIGGTLPVACPATIGSPDVLAAGIRRLGNPAATDLPLTDASIATIAPADYDPDKGNLSESEADDVEGDDVMTAATFSYAPSLPAVSLVCRYGKSILPLSGEAMLMIPLKPQWAKCRYVAAQAGRQASMTCRQSKPVE